MTWGGAARKPHIYRRQARAVRHSAHGASDPQELADRTGTAERYVREWLNAQAAGSYVTYAGDGRYTLSPEQAEALTNEDSPACVLGGFQGLTAATGVRDRLIERVQDGEGHGCHGYYRSQPLREGTERFFRLGTSPTWYRRGSRRSTVWWRSWRREPTWPTSAAAAEPRPSSWRKHFPVRDSRIRLPRTVNRGSDASAQAEGLGNIVPRGGGEGLSRHVRPRVSLRLPARHGRSGGSRPAHAGVVEGGRDLDAR